MIARDFSQSPRWRKREEKHTQKNLPSSDLPPICGGFIWFAPGAGRRINSRKKASPKEGGKRVVVARVKTRLSHYVATQGADIGGREIKVLRLGRFSHTQSRVIRRGRILLHPWQSRQVQKRSRVLAASFVEM